MAASKRQSESIRDFLCSRYPSHPRLQDYISRLDRAGFRKLDELQNVSFHRSARYVSQLFCFALRDFVKEGGPDPVITDCTPTMSLSHTETTVKLRDANNIPHLPLQYSPMFDDPISQISPDPASPASTSVSCGSDEEELELLDASSVDVPPDDSLLELKMLTFDWPGTLEAIWCSYSGSKLIVRNEYIAVKDQVQAFWAGGIKAVLLLGVPGIGKTGFIILMLLQLIKARKPVVFQTKGGSCYFFEPQAPGEDHICYKLQDNSILMDSEVYFLADGKLPNVPDFSGNALLASTPKLANYQDFSKDGRGAQVLLPVWSAAEIALAWQEIYDPDLQPWTTPEEGRQEQFRARKALTLDVVKERYRKWGGTARYVLAMPHIDLDAIIRSLQSVQATVEAVSKQVADGDHPSHKLVHMKIQPGYEKYEYMFASPYVAQAARRKLKETTSQSLRRFLTFQGLEAHGADGLKGIIFQGELKDIARHTKKWKVREVFEDDTQALAEDVTFEFGEPLDAANLASLPSRPPVNRIIWPESKIEETIDAMRIVRRPGQPDILELHQATISSKRFQHGLKYGAVLNIMKKFRIPPNRTIIYIDKTSELFPTGGYQNWRKSRKLVLKDSRILKKLEGIRQYVVDTGI